MATTLVKINAALEAAKIDAKLVTIYAGKHQFVGPDAPQSNPVVTHTPLGRMSPDEWVALCRERASERMPELADTPSLESWSQRPDIDVTGMFTDWSKMVRTNGKHKREFRKKVASLCEIEPESLLLMRPSYKKPGWDKSGGSDAITDVPHWFLSFDYHPEIVDIVRDLPARWFSNYTKEWAIPAEFTDDIIDQIGPYFSVIVDTAAEVVFSNDVARDIRRSNFDLLSMPYSFPIETLHSLFENEYPAIFNRQNFVNLSEYPSSGMVQTRYPFLLLRDGGRHMVFSPISGEIEDHAYGKEAGRLIAVFKSSCKEHGEDALVIGDDQVANRAVLWDLFQSVRNVSMVAEKVNATLSGINLRMVPSDIATTCPQNNAQHSKEFIAYVWASSSHLNELGKRIYQDRDEKVVRPVVISSHWQDDHTAEEWLDIVCHEAAHWIVNDLPIADVGSIRIPICSDKSHGILFHLAYAALRTVMGFTDNRSVTLSMMSYRDKNGRDFEDGELEECLWAIEKTLPDAMRFLDPFEQRKAGEPLASYDQFIFLLDRQIAAHIAKTLHFDDEAVRSAAHIYHITGSVVS